MSPAQPTQALHGLTVVALEHAVAAPLATRQLADLGARVIKVERPGSGDFARGYDQRARGLASHFVWANRGKESLALDLKRPRARELLLKLIIDKADVVVQNLAPGAAARLGVSFQALRPQRPDLIVCDISGYGDDPAHPGPYRDKKAYDLLIQSESGFLSITGTPEQPAKAGLSIADIAAGMFATQRILAALLQRQVDGQGQRIDISMLESMAEWMGYPMYYTLDGAAPPARSGASHATIYPYGPFATGDGKSVMLGVQNEREWQRFCEQVLGQAGLAGDARFAGVAQRSANRAALDAIIVAAFAELTAQQVMQRLEAADIANAQVNDVAGLWTHPQLAARRRWVQMDSPAGALPALLPPGIAAADAGAPAAVPALGQHSEAILAELGLSAAEIAAEISASCGQVLYKD